MPDRNWGVTMKSTLRIGLVALLLSGSAHAATVVLQNGLNGYVGCADTYVVMASDRAQGAKTNLVVEGYHCTLCIDQRALIRFDLTAVPAGADVSKATLSVYSIDQPRPGASRIHVHRVTRLWAETTAAWYTASTGTLWTTEGGDFYPVADTSYTYGTAVGLWHSVDITGMVRDQIGHPDQNFGLMLFMEPSMFTVRYASSNATDPTLRPKLTLEGSGVSAIRSVAPQRSIAATLSVEKNHLIRASMPGVLRMTDLSGRQIAVATGTAMDVSGTAAGIYLVQLVTKNVTVVRRIMINR